jgi:hypothetical protein
MAIKKACLVKNSVKNTGKECDTSMVATAMLIAVPRSLKWTDEDLADPVAWLDNLIHEAPASRVFPLFGQQAPIRTITNSAAEDIKVTLDDGLEVFLRYGLYNRTFETTSGGLCYAQSLQSLNKSGYSLIEIDQQGQMLMRRNSDGTLSGLIVDFMYAPSPILPDFKNTPYKNRFQYTFSPVELVNNAVIYEGATSLLSLMGLIDVKYTNAATPTNTDVTIGVFSECAEEDLVAKFPVSGGNGLCFANNFKITKKSDGTDVSITGAAVVSGAIKLTATLVSSEVYVVTGAAPLTWKGHAVVGYDGESSSIEITIP